MYVNFLKFSSLFGYEKYFRSLPSKFQKVFVKIRTSNSGLPIKTVEIYSFITITLENIKKKIQKYKYILDQKPLTWSASKPV